MSFHNIPAGWQRLEFGDFARRSKARFNPVGAAESRMCIELEHIDQQTGQLLGYVDSALQSSIKSVFEPNQVLFGKLRPYLQKYWLADKPGVCTSEIWVLMVDPEICTPEYLFYLVQSPEFIRACGVTSGSKMPRADWDLVAQYPLLVPSLDQQSPITATLRTWDEAIALQTRQLRQLQRRLTKMREDLLLAKRRLDGFSKPWQEVEIGTLLKEVKRRVIWNENEEYALISMRRRSGGAFLRERLFGHQILTKNLRTAHAGDFLISKRQIVHGASGLVPAELDGMKISDAYVALVARNPAAFDVKFFDCLSKMPWFYHLCYVCSHGIHIEKMMFNSADFLSRIIKVPDLDEQRAIAEVLNTAEVEIRLAERKLAALREQKRGLLQQLLTGEILLS